MATFWVDSANWTLTSRQASAVQAQGRNKPASKPWRSQGGQERSPGRSQAEEGSVTNEEIVQRTLGTPAPVLPGVRLRVQRPLGHVPTSPTVWPTVRSRRSAGRTQCQGAASPHCGVSASFETSCDLCARLRFCTSIHIGSKRRA